MDWKPPPPPTTPPPPPPLPLLPPLPLPPPPPPLRNNVIHEPYRVPPYHSYNTTTTTTSLPPSRLAVYTELGVEARNIVGPFTEGDTLRLTCRATGGSPPPTVTWWEGPALLDMTPEVETLDQVTNTLVVPSLTRRDLHRTLTCQAANSNLTAPLSTTVTLDMNFPPLWVRLLSSRDPLSAGRTYEVVCQAAGARPPAVIGWHLGNTRLTTHTDKGNVTKSELLLTPEVGDGRKVLSCLAESPALTLHPLVDEWLLDVYSSMIHYTLAYHLTLWHDKLHPDKTHYTSARPTTPRQDPQHPDKTHYAPARHATPRQDPQHPDKTHYAPARHATPRQDPQHPDKTHNTPARPPLTQPPVHPQGTELQHNVTAGVIISNQSLVLQRVARTASGNYYCVASNIEGDGQSNPIRLKVKYAPVCRNPQMAYHGAARFEQVNIPCYLDAHPKPVSFRWTFNNSGESVDIPQEHIHVDSTGSTVSYTPNTELDYGTLLCWGTNVVGLQRRPCVFHVFPAAVVNVRCMAGFDGGLPQTFILELYHPRTSTLLANTTNSVPTFSVPDLPAGVALRGVVYSTNAKGGSEKLSLQVYTLKDVAERRTAAVKPSPTHGKSSAHFSLTPIIVLVLGAVGGILIVVIVICVVVRVRYAGRSGGVGQCKRANVQDIAVDQEDPSSAACHPKMAPTSLQDSVPPPPVTPRDFDEKNPDVIPQSEADSWVVEGVNTISSASLPTTYATLPRSQHLCTLANYQQQPCAAGDVQYAELMLGGATPSPQHHDIKRGPPDPQRTATTNPQHHEPQRVIYATLDHKRSHSHYPPPHQHPAYPQPVATTNTTPTHALHLQSTPTNSGGHPQGTQHPPWTPSTASIGRRHSLRRDPHTGDPETVVPLIPNQKESSV
ncbi:Nephrin-like 1 [Homarus americanus]|uniref:Nephrin-like 1 n=1 Tax=Homarus americanus TaxID=6706 RepID=A0A8J5JZY5_HOMAM|nr:Nephrin-like 1 [Homarus americanus]